MVLVTGASGFIGSHLVSALRAAGSPLRAQVRRPAAHSPADLTVACDLGAYPGVRAAVAGCSCVFHVASSYRRGDWPSDEDGVRNLVRACSEAGVRRLVFLSSLDVIMAPGSDYARAKKRAEAVLEASGLEVCVVRPSLVYGDRDHLVAGLLRLAKWLPFVPVPGDGHWVRRPLYVGDLVAVLQPLCHGPRVPGAVNVAGPDEMTLREMAEAVARNLAGRRRILEVPTRLVGLVSRALGRAGLVTDHLVDKAVVPPGLEITYGKTRFAKGLQCMVQGPLASLPDE